MATDEVNAQIDGLNTILKKYDENGMLIGEAPCTCDLITITNHDFDVVNSVSIGAVFVLILLVLHSALLLALPGFLGWILPVFLYRAGVARQTAKVTPFIEAKYDEIDEICARGHSLL